MKKPPRDNERNREVIAFYYQIFGHRIRQGMRQADARKEACDAVSLRYGISAGTLVNIISALKTSHNVHNFEYRQRALSLIHELNNANDELVASVEKNNRLIALLEETLDAEH